jgi:transposase-like protein
VYLQSKRNGATAKWFFKQILKRHGDELEILLLINCEVMMWLIEN